MALKDTWIPKKNTTDGSDGDYIMADDINEIAEAVIDLEKNENSDSNKYYTKAEIDEKLKNPSYEEQVKLKGITTAVPHDEYCSVYIEDNSISSSGARFTIDIQGDVKIECACSGEPDNMVDFYIDAELVAQCKDGETFSFDGHVDENIQIECVFMDVRFTEFTKKVYVKDAVGDINGKIGDIDTALDELHNYATSLIGGDA